MKILWAKAGKLLPVDTGGKIRSFNILRRLREHNDVTLLSYYDGPRDRGYEAALEEQFPGSIAINTGGGLATNRLAVGIKYLRHLASPAPFAVTKFTARSVQSQIAELLAGGTFDVAVCDFLAATLNFPKDLKTPTVLFQHNVESALWKRQAQHEPDWINRMVFKLEAAKMLAYEREAVRRFHHVIAVSDNDRELMSEMTDRSEVTVVPTGVDLQRYRAAKRASNDSGDRHPVVVFVGSMDWEANIDGVEYFCREIWPSIKQRVPEARFRIVGRDPHPRVQRLASDSVEVTGTVESVIEHYDQAMVNIVPLRIGGGTRLKIYEAMAMGRATVSTSIGAEGLDVDDGADILIADTADKFADSVIELLEQESLRRQLEDGASNKAAKYDWSVIAERFNDVLERVANRSEKVSLISNALVSAEW